MKVIWEVKDIKPGIRVGRNLTVKGERHIIGYIVPQTGDVIKTITSLIDGGTWFQGTASDIANVLNKEKLIPVELMDKE